MIKERFFYNTMGQLIEKEEKDGRRISYAYTPQGSLKEVKDKSTGDLKGAYAYNYNSQLKTITYGNGLVSSFTYDANNRIKTENYKLGDKTLQSNNYAYDLQGNMTTKTVGDLTESYTYDALSRL